MTRFGVLGSAVVGQTLARGLKARGHDVRIGSRSPDKLAEFARTAGVPAGTFAQVAARTEHLVLAVAGPSRSTCSRPPTRRTCGARS